MAKVFPLSEGVFTVGHDKQFVPFNVSDDELTDRPTGSLLVDILPFLVVTDRDVILFDTGLGYKGEDGVLQIHANLRKHGYEPDDVTKVLMSHLHKDHAGGVVYEDNGTVKTTFPSADYYIYRAEAEFALAKGLPSYFPDQLEPLFASGQVQWLDDEEGMIDGYIKYTHSGGHCPEHIVYLIDDGESKVFFGGDEAPQLKQMRIKYVAKYDYDGKKALALRQQYAAEGKEEGWEFLFYHDVQSPNARL